jgi:hypothetical protein
VVCDLWVSWQVRLEPAQVHRPALAAVVYEPDYRRRAVMDWRTERAPRTMILWKRRQFQVAGRLQHHNRLVIPVLRRFPHLIARPLERHSLDLVAIGWEPKGIPCNCDPATADAKESAEVDDSSPDMSGSIHNDVDDPPHVLVGRAANFLAKDALHVAVIENGSAAATLGLLPGSLDDRSFCGCASGPLSAVERTVADSAINPTIKTAAATAR